MVYEIWLFLIALVGVIIPLVLPFDLSSSSPHLNFPSITPLFDFISPLSLWYFLHLLFFSTPSPYFASFRSQAPPKKHTYTEDILFNQVFLSEGVCRHFGLGYLQKGSSVQSERRGTYSVPAAEGISDKKQPQGPSLWQKGNLKDIITKKQRKQEYDQLAASAC